ncbi:MAG: GUN4 domain-containing protein [Microcoleus sp.]
MLVFIIILVVILVVVWVNSNTSNRVQGNSSKQKFPTVDESQLNDDLSSAVGIDYRKLRNFLAVGDFESANKEIITIFTKLIYPMKEVGNIRNQFFYLDIGVDEEIYEDRVERIPCTDICTMERLWVKYSSGHFGFRIQSEINQQLYRQFYEEIVEFNRKEKINMAQEEVHLRTVLKTQDAFKKQLKWDQDSLIFNHSAPSGHLPKILSLHIMTRYKHQVMLLNRVTDCIDS